MTPAETENELARLHTGAFAWAMACCGRRREEAEDVLQASYLKILDGRARFAGRSAFRTFLFGVIRRTAAEERRRSAVGRLFFGSGTSGKDADEAKGAEQDAPEDRLALRAALTRVARRQREVLELVFAFGMTVEEDAVAMGTSVGSARVHYARGKKRLAALLGGVKA
jgi:RNA polymerase sigma-70 factor (ECF subfamily)